MDYGPHFREPQTRYRFKQGSRILVPKSLIVSAKLRVWLRGQRIGVKVGEIKASIKPSRVRLMTLRLST